MATRTTSRTGSPAARSLADALEHRLARELEGLRRRLAARARPAPRPGRARRPASRPPPVLALASDVAAGLRAQGVRDASLVQGEIVVPGTSVPAPHAWVESGDRVHDHTQGEFRKVWPRELYYRVFRATRRAA
jgi:hypothetical protein